jgi:cytochrome d ubiquinol oxidase subunit I
MLTFTPITWMSFLLLGITTLVHITFVNLVLGFSVITPFTEYLSYRHKDKQLMDVAKRTFKYLILTDLVAGVWGTWMTVALAGLWPTLTYIATTVLFVPITIALIGILIAIPAIGIYWYTWDRVSRRVHLFVGCLMAFGALLVPTGFRMIFAFVDDPVGMNEALKGNLFAVFENPIYPIWVVWSWFGALAMSALVAAGTYAWRSRRRPDPAALKATTYFIKVGMPCLAVTAIVSGVFFWLLPGASPYIYASLIGNTSVAQYDFLAPLLAYPALIVIAGAAALTMFYMAKRGPVNRLLSPIVVVSAFVTVPLVEAVIDAARAPYIVITGQTGLPANAFSNSMIPISWTIAELAVTIAVVVMGTFFVGIYFIYKVRSGPTPEDAF